MNRQLFIKNVGLSLATVVAGPLHSLFSESKITVSKLKLSALKGNGGHVILAGKFLDSETLEIISANILIEKANSNISKYDKIENAYSYELSNNLGEAYSEKLHFKISAKGYKTLHCQMVMNKSGINIDSSIWQYNPDFKAENRPNEHQVENGVLKAKFDFHLIKN